MHPATTCLCKNFKQRETTMAQEKPSPKEKTYTFLRWVLTGCLAVGAYFVPWVHAKISSVRTSLQTHNGCRPLAGRHLRVGITPWVGFGGALLAEDRWQSEVELVNLEDSDWEEALSGCVDSEKKVDVLWTSIDSWAAQYPALSRNADFTDQLPPVAIMEIARSSEACALMVAPGVIDLDKQPDGKIGAPALTTAHAIALQSINRKRVISPIQSSEAALQQFLDGQLVGVALCEPYLQRLRRERPRAERADQKKEEVFILVARPEVVQQAQLVKLAQSWVQGNEVSTWKSDDIIDAFRKREEAGVWENYADDATLRSELKDTKWPTLEGNKTLFYAKSGKTDSDYDAQFDAANRLWVDAEMGVQPTKAVRSRTPDFINKLAAPAKVELCDSDKVRYRETVLFELGSYQVKDERPIRAALSKLSQYQKPQVCIFGYTDRTGRDGFDNQKLSGQRADEVAKRFYGVPNMRIIALGRGDGELIENTDGPSQRNRRAEIRVVVEKEP